MEKPTPRINSSLAILTTSDQGNLSVNLSQDCPITTTYVEIIGKVEPNLQISGYSSVALGNNFDLDAYNKLVIAAANNPSLFR
ncbi:hypothetical protein BB559_001036 [Furculomyces boomerangus]|uniref:Replication factor A protein 3 n=2 Tax=Harpellales TaxID=61421 RepID=A0A2T9Z3A4_9FUNG|nr:hypothetical protein BB559_001036 [Furculomyces boomerangus]PVZ99051.1 hypothetical protein BB558_004939 [Smittium angustum]